MTDAQLHWFLNLMVTDPAPMRWILPSVHVPNCPPIPGYQPNDYGKALSSLLDQGLIELYNELAPAITSRDMLIRAFEGNIDRTTVLQLTERGGKVWEGLAQPQWHKYVKFELILGPADRTDHPISGLLASQNLDAIIAHLGWYEELNSVKIAWPTVNLVTHADYEITYWRHLPDVHEAKFQGAQQATDLNAPRFVTNWMLSLSRWHLKPWERHDWPSR